MALLWHDCVTTVSLLCTWLYVGVDISVYTSPFVMLLRTLMYYHHNHSHTNLHACYTDTYGTVDACGVRWLYWLYVAGLTVTTAAFKLWRRIWGL